jgi:hypothetical protein
LTSGFKSLINKSNEVTAEDIKFQYEDDVQRKLEDHPLLGFFTELGKCLEGESDGARELRKTLTQKRKRLKTSASPVTDSVLSQSSIETEVHIVESVSSPQSLVNPESFTTTGHKRDPSKSSVLTNSTDTSASQLDQAEPLVQALQNSFVEDIMKSLGWRNGIKVTWAKGREMWLQYTE